LSIHAAAEYHFFRWPDRVLTLYGNGRNPHSAPLLARRAVSGSHIENLAPVMEHGRHYPRYNLTISGDDELRNALWIGKSHNDIRALSWHKTGLLYHVVADAQGIRRVA